ncbi:MAG: hypothetical protein WC933_00105 [Candidatus Paceibacterota bacterium]|jgi:hypothetical protein
MKNLRQHIDLAVLVLSKGNLKSIVVTNFQMCHGHGETVSEMMNLLNVEEKNIVEDNFFIKVKENKILKKE